MSNPGRKVTIRMPDHEGPGSSEVIGIHVDPGGSVRESFPVMTIMTAQGEHRVRAPRTGTVLPIVSVGDTVNGSDALFVLTLDESALSTEKAKAKPSPLRQKSTSPLREKPPSPLRMPEPDAPASEEAPVPPLRVRPQQARPPVVYEDVQEERTDWLKPCLALAVYAIASFLLFPFFLQMGEGASPFELAALGGMAVAIVLLVVAFLMPSHGAWPRRIVRVLSLGWLMMLAYPLYPAVMNAPLPAAIALEAPATGGGVTETPSVDR